MSDAGSEGSGDNSETEYAEDEHDQRSTRQDNDEYMGDDFDLESDNFKEG